MKELSWLVGDDLFLKESVSGKILRALVPGSFLPGIQAAGRADDCSP